jgi:glycine dehydrogenase
MSDSSASLIPFSRRHIGPSTEDINEMCRSIGRPSLESLIDATVPPGIRLKRPLALPAAASEEDALAELHAMMSRNRVLKGFIGMGYHNCHVPGVIKRNIFENPGWYTQYTPYQAEIAQGRLEALLNFQTMIADLTGLPVTNASLLDEATAAAEAMALAYAVRKDKTSRSFLIDAACHPQTIAVLRTRAEPLGIVCVTGANDETLPSDVFGAITQYPETEGVISDLRAWTSAIHNAEALAIVACDPLALVLLESPGACGADIVVGSAQRFGVPMGYGGPHAAFFAIRDEYKRHMPGRLVGVSRDADGGPALRLSLQTREQHIRREKATSNICTAQVLLAVMASMYAVYHGPDGLRAIALKAHRLARRAAEGIRATGHTISITPFFDTFAIELNGASAEDISSRAIERSLNIRVLGENRVSVAVDETTTEAELAALVDAFNISGKATSTGDVNVSASPAFALRQDPILTHPVFNSHRTETEMLRYIRRLESRDLSLTTSMIPLGSCTMKLNASSEMYPVSWPTVGALHPFAPADQTSGYDEMATQLEKWLAEITGFAAVSLQPNAGSQGEYAGLLAIRAFHASRGEDGRNICLIPTSAHGTNPASAVMAGYQVVAVACDLNGNIDMPDLRAKAQAHSANLAAMMITYPSTHGVFETHIRECCAVVHESGGQVYMDGANLNAQVGLCSPGDIGADVCHLNLHKTFCIPHGGGGPGMGPIAVAKHLSTFLPRDPIAPAGSTGSGAVSAAPLGSASILVISWMYIRMMGPDGLVNATKVAILNANYIASRLNALFPVLYRGADGLVAHECIVDLRGFKESAGIEVDDVAKRLMDYGFHAPTMSWPVPGTMMIEPTESEPRAELDRFCEAMISIHAEIMAVAEGRADRQNNVLKRAPHTAPALLNDKWDRPYSREQAAFPKAWVRDRKFWPHVARIDNVYGDRNLVCTCPPVDAY